MKVRFKKNVRIDLDGMKAFSVGDVFEMPEHLAKIKVQMGEAELVDVKKPVVEQKKEIKKEVKVEKKQFKPAKEDKKLNVFKSEKQA